MQRATDGRDTCGVVRRMLGGDGAARKKIVHLTDATARNTRGRQRVEQCLGRRSDREVAAVGGAREVSVAANERTSDDAGYIVGRHQHLACGGACAIEFIERDYVLVRGYLEDGIG